MISLNKKLITIAEIIFALVFIVMLAVLFTSVMNFSKDTNTKIEGLQKQIADAELESYNGGKNDNNKMVVSGATVQSTINKLKTTNNGLKLSYIVKIGTSYTQYGHSYISSGSGSGNSALINGLGESVGVKLGTYNDTYKTYGNLKPGATGFISPVKEFKSQLLFNKNGVLVGIYFEQQ